MGNIYSVNVKSLYNNSVVIENESGIPPEYQLKAYNSRNIFQRNWHRNKFEAIKLYLNSISGLKDKRALDIGTGSGNFEFLFHPKFKKIIGIDHNEEVITFLNDELDNRNIKNVETFILDIVDINPTQVPSNLDVIVICDVIEHVHHKHADNLLKVLRSKLNPSGKIIVITPNYKSSWVLIEKLLDKSTIAPKFAYSQHLAQYDPWSLHKLFTHNGFSNVMMSTINTLGFISPIERLSKFITKMEMFSGFKYGNLIFSVFQK